MACINHPQTEEVVHCDKCEVPLCADCSIPIHDQTLCVECKNLLVKILQSGEEFSVVDKLQAPWEAKASLSSLFETAREIMLHPARFFSTLEPYGKGHWSFAFVIALPAMMIGTVAQLLYTGALTLNNTIVMGVLIAMPIQLLIKIAITAGYMHLMLRLTGGLRAKSDATLRVVAFAHAPLCLSVVPVIGDVVAKLWFVICMVIGLRELHQVTVLRLILICLVPLLFVLGMLAVSFGLLIP